MNTELNNLVEAFSKLSDEEQVKEIEEKIKTLIGVLNQFNENKELLLVPTEDKQDADVNYTNIFNLLCCLEEEVGKLLNSTINIE